MMNTYLPINQTNWRSRFGPYSQFLRRWGWFVLLAIILTTICSSLLPDILSGNSYQATLQVQVQLPSGDSSLDINTSTTFFSSLFTSPGTLSTALPQLHKLQQFQGLQLADLQGLVSASPVSIYPQGVTINTKGGVPAFDPANTNVILLNALGDTPHDATVLVTVIYQALLQRVHADRSLVTLRLSTALSSELKQSEADLVTTTAQLQSLSATSQTSSSQYRQLSSLSVEQKQRVNTISGLLLSLGQQGFGTNDLLQLGSSVPEVTTIQGPGPTQGQRLALSPLIGLIMGVGGILLAGLFSNTLPLNGKKRERVLPYITGVFPTIPQLRQKRLGMLLQTVSPSLALLRRLRYQANEHEKRLQLITVISPKGREGKSTIATSLAIAAAQSGQRTLLVDANPRKPILHTWFKLPNTDGLLNTMHSLAAGIPVSSPIHESSITKLSLVPIGNTTQKEKPSDTTEEPLQIGELRRFIELLHEQADLIIFDGPALLTDACTANLAILSDVVLLVVDAKKSQSTVVLEAEALLSEMGISFATVLNRARPEAVE